MSKLRAFFWKYQLRLLIWNHPILVSSPIWRTCPSFRLNIHRMMSLAVCFAISFANEMCVTHRRTNGKAACFPQTLKSLIIIREIAMCTADALILFGSFEYFFPNCWPTLFVRVKFAYFQKRNLKGFNGISMTPTGSKWVRLLRLREKLHCDGDSCRDSISF